MRCKKLAIIGILLVFLLVVSCTPEPGPSAEDIWQKVLWFGTLGFVGDYDGGMVGFMRILIFILVFGLLYTVAGVVPGLNQNRNLAIAVALILSIISILFIPDAILIGVGAAYATIVSVILIGAPIVGGYLLFRAIPEDNKLARIFVLLVLLFVLIAVKSHATGYL